MLIKSDNSSYLMPIDSLRAIAVLSVIIYHLDPGLLPGGYAGVDIFFVISGFLITRTLLRGSTPVILSKRELFSFYKKRFMRIYPLYSLIVLLFISISCYIYLPSDLLVQAKQSIATVLLIPNYYFMNNLDVSYFSVDAKNALFLHLWSVGVEVQNYIIWGLLFFLISGRKTACKITVLTLIAVASLYYSQRQLTTDPMVSFYSPVLRMWEFAAGSLCFFIRNRYLASRIFSLIANITGTGLIVFSCLMLKESDPYPGLRAVPCVIGVSLLIISISNAPQWSGWMLNPVLRRIGVLSYSMYLWHWPLIVLWQYEYGSVQRVPAVLILSLTIILSVLSEKYIESPFRETHPLNKHKITPGIRGRITILSLTVAAVSIICLYISSVNGYVNTDDKALDRKQKEIEEFTRPAYLYDFNCQLQNTFSRSIFDDARCITGNRERAPQMLIAGDSNAAHFVGYLSEVARAEQLAFRNATQSSSPPFAGEVAGKYTGINGLNACKDYNQTLRQYAEKYDVIFIGALWSKYYENEDFRTDFEQMIRDFSSGNKQIIIASQIPLFDSYDKNCALKQMKSGFLNCEQRLREPVVTLAANAFIAEMGKKYRNLHIFNIAEMLCDKTSCNAGINDKPVYYDREHLSMNGSAYLGFLALRQNKVPFFLRADFFNGLREVAVPVREPDPQELWNTFR